MEIGNYLPKEQSPVSQLKTTEKRAEKLTEKNNFGPQRKRFTAYS
jgi:hypothetical protein